MSKFRFSVGPWNVHEGRDVFGPEVRPAIAFAEKLAKFREIGFDAIQFHDDDAVPNMNDLGEQEIIRAAREVRRQLDDHGLAAEFVAPRLWEDPRTVDGAFTSNDPAHREFALWRARRSVDIAHELGCRKIVLWLAREGTLCFESKDPRQALHWLVEGLNQILDYHHDVLILIEPKPNEPIDRSFCPTIGHVLGVAAQTKDPSRVGGLVESAHATLAGQDPANEISFALAFDKLWGVHLNDQNGMRYDQDKSFAVENLRQGFNQVRLLIEAGYGERGEYVGLDVKALRTQPVAQCYRHLENSLKIFKMLEEKARRFDYALQRDCIEKRDYERLEMHVMELLMTGQGG